MDKTFLVYVLFGMAFLYVINTFLHDVTVSDDVQTCTTNVTLSEKEELARYIRHDETGAKILDVSTASADIQEKAWEHLSFKNELVDLFPDFDTMKLFIKNRVIGEPLRSRILKRIDQVEDKFLSGEISAEKAKDMLLRLK
jgi:hypothetical protein